MVTSLADPSANVIFGAVIEDQYEGEVHVTIIATGFSQSFEEGLLQGKTPVRAPSCIPRYISGVSGFGPADRATRRCACLPSACCCLGGVQLRRACSGARRRCASLLISQLPWGVMLRACQLGAYPAHKRFLSVCCPGVPTGTAAPGKIKGRSGGNRVGPQQLVCGTWPQAMTPPADCAVEGS